MATFIELVSGEFLCGNLFTKRKTKRKLSFYNNIQLNCISCPIVHKVIFCSDFPVIPKSWWRKEEEERQFESVLIFDQTQKLFDKVDRELLHKTVETMRVSSIFINFIKTL